MESRNNIENLSLKKIIKKYKQIENMKHDSIWQDQQPSNCYSMPQGNKLRQFNFKTLT